MHLIKLAFLLFPITLYAQAQKHYIKTIPQAYEQLTVTAPAKIQLVPHQLQTTRIELKVHAQTTQQALDNITRTGTQYQWKRESINNNITLQLTGIPNIEQDIDVIIYHPEGKTILVEPVSLAL
jgi:hypothetical protein